MKYLVIVTPEAEANISEAFEYIFARSPLNAQRWLGQLYREIEGLELFPRRCGEAREQANHAEELRQLIFKSHRLIFTIDDATQRVLVVYVRHAKMLAVDEIGEP